MSQALYRKYRPKEWDEVMGQNHIVTTLKNAIAADRVAHAYLFAGSRGTGKTTLARLLAKAVNCLNPDSAKHPDNQCENCKAVNENRFLDLIEIDAASNTSVDDVRDLRDKINFSPSQGKYKIYIIDEVHMLSNQAFNALLKTLEEPPPHAIFVLATTEIHKIPATVLSRCQRHEFRRVPVDEIVTNLTRRGLERANGATVDLGSATLDARSGRLLLANLAIADPEKLDTDLFRAKTLEATVSTRDLLRKRIAIDQLTSAARAAGARRFVTQSIAFLYAPEGSWVKNEEAPVWTDPPEPFRTGAGPTIAHEQEALAAEGIESLVLRYGFFYGPGTAYAADGAFAEDAKRGRLPVVGAGGGIFSFIHVDDAAAATVASIATLALVTLPYASERPVPADRWSSYAIFARSTGLSHIHYATAVHDGTITEKSELGVIDVDTRMLGDEQGPHNLDVILRKYTGDVHKKDGTEYLKAIYEDPPVRNHLLMLTLKHDDGTDWTTRFEYEGLSAAGHGDPRRGIPSQGRYE